LAGPALPQDREEEFLAQIRAHVAFEKMVVAALISAAICGLSIGLLEFSRDLLRGVSIYGVTQAFIDTLAIAGFVFLGGFGGAAIVGIPIFRALDDARKGAWWPYLIAAIVLNLTILALAGVAPTFSDPSRFLWLAPGIMIALIYHFLMRPVFAQRRQRAASGSANAGAAPQSNGASGNIVKLPSPRRDH
jgi:hypothetical protein